MQLALNIVNESVAEKLLWFLEHFKSEGIEITTIEDLEDLKLLQEARKERDSIDLEEFLKEQ
ncbi:MAG: hypothetical protein JXK05_00850 [Campylobacterales bacterium]|nr:hypothetical protein [Campylobacterales bacterium]